MVTGTRWYRVGIGLLALVIAAYLSILPPPEQTTPVPEGAQGDRNTEAIAEMLAELDSGELETEAKAVAAERGLFPSGTTCALRRPGVLQHAARQVRARFAAAAFATDPDFKRELLVELAGLEQPSVRARAELGLAELALRRRDPAAAVVHAKRLLAEPELPRTCHSDGWFILAAAASEVGAREDALLKAVAFDPGSWNAELGLAKVLAASLERPAPGDLCVHRARQLIRTVVMLDQLAESDEQLFWVETKIGATSAGATGTGIAGVTPARALVIGMVRERSGRQDAAAAIYREGVAAVATTRCGEILKSALKARLQSQAAGRS